MLPQHLRQAGISSVLAPSCQDATPGGHAGVGVVSLHGAPSHFPELLLLRSKSFFGWAEPCGLYFHWATKVSHTSLFFFMDAKGRKANLRNERVQTNILLPCLLKPRCAVLVSLLFWLGGFNADPLVSPSSAKGISEGAWIDVEKAFASGRGEAPTPTHANSNWMRVEALVVVLLLFVPPTAVAATTSGNVLADRWFTTSFCHPNGILLSRHGMPRLKWPMCILPNGLPAGFSMYGSFPPLFV